MVKIAVATALVAATLVPAVASGGTNATARITGAIHLAGGPAPGRHSHNEPGTVTLRHVGAHKVTARQTVRSGHGFAFRVLPGRYKLSATSSGGKCRTSVVQAQAGRTMRTNVYCDVR